MHHKKIWKLPTSSPIYVYINRINNRLVPKIKDGYKLELQTRKTMKLFRGTQAFVFRKKNEENVTNVEVVEVFLVNAI